MVGPHRLPCETPVPREPAEAPAHPSRHSSPRASRWVLPATILGSSLGYIDSSVVNVALPAIQRSLETRFAILQWVVNGYMLALASLILLGGLAGDRFGRRRIFLLGLAGFAIASFACAVAPTPSWLIGARVAQGAAAALLIPASLAIIGASYTGAARGPAIGMWAAAGALTTALGPPLGGWLIDTIGWRAIFLLNLPVAAIALLLGLKLPADSMPTQGAPFDSRGAALAVIALGALSYGLIALGEGNRIGGWSAIAAAIPAAWLFLRVEARSTASMMPLELFRRRAFSGVNALTVSLYAALSAALFILPFILIEVQHYSATAAGAALLPFSAVMGLGSRWAGALVERIGAKLPLIVGPLVTAAGFVTLAVSDAHSSYWTGFLPGLLIVASGMTLSVAPLTTTVFNTSPAESSGAASGINNAAARTGSLLAVAALGLAFGGQSPGSMESPASLQAYQVVMFAAATLACLSALLAALTIESNAHDS